MTLSSRVIKAGRQVSGHRIRLAWRSPEPKPPSVDLEAEVAAVIERAKAEARAVLEEAERQAQQRTQEGYEEGVRQGREEGLRAVTDEWAPVRDALAQSLAELQDLQDVCRGLRDDRTWAQAAALAAALFDRKAKDDPEALVPYWMELADAVDSSQVTLFLDPGFRDRIADITARLQEAGSTLTVAIDQTLQPGEMRAEGQAGGVIGGALAGLHAVLEEVRREWAKNA